LLVRARGLGREGQREREINRYLIPDINMNQSILNKGEIVGTSSFPAMNR
jgi:hypothetical protein